jgi:hypothetical protein
MLRNEIINEKISKGLKRVGLVLCLATLLHAVPFHIDLSGTSQLSLQGILLRFAWQLLRHQSNT